MSDQTTAFINKAIILRYEEIFNEMDRTGTPYTIAIDGEGNFTIDRHGLGWIELTVNGITVIKETVSPQYTIGIIKG